MQRLDGQVALVTGASRGVGKGIALELASAGATVYITGRRVEDMRYISGKGNAIECDHRDDEQVQSAFRRIADEQGRLDVLVNNVWAATRTWLRTASLPGRALSGSSRSGAGTQCSRPGFARTMSPVLTPRGRWSGGWSDLDSTRQLVKSSVARDGEIGRGG